jgi:hypothetical protein
MVSGAAVVALAFDQWEMGRGFKFQKFPGRVKSLVPGVTRLFTGSFG